MFQAQNRETINSTWKVAVSFKIIMMTSVTRSCFIPARPRPKPISWSQTGLVIRPTVSDHITGTIIVGQYSTKCCSYLWQAWVSRFQCHKSPRFFLHFTAFALNIYWYRGSSGLSSRVGFESVFGRTRLHKCTSSTFLKIFIWVRDIFSVSLFIATVEYKTTIRCQRITKHWRS